MKRRSFIQGVLAVIGAGVTAKLWSQPQMLTDVFPDGINATQSTLSGQRWVLDPDCERTRIYYMNQFQVGDCVRFLSRQTDRMDYQRKRCRLSRHHSSVGPLRTRPNSAALNASASGRATRILSVSPSESGSYRHRSGRQERNERESQRPANSAAESVD